MTAFVYTQEDSNAHIGWRCKPEFLAEIEYPTNEEILWEINNLREIENPQ